MDKDYINKLIMYKEKLDSCHTDNYLNIEEIKENEDKIKELEIKIRELAKRRDNIHQEILMSDGDTSFLNNIKNSYNSQLLRLYDELEILDNKAQQLKWIEVSHEFSSQKELITLYNSLFGNTNDISLDVSVNDFLEELFKLIPYSEEEVSVSLKINLDINKRLYERSFQEKINNKRQLLKAYNNIYNIDYNNEEIPMIIKIYLGNKEVIAIDWNVSLNKRQGDGKTLLKHLEYNDCELVIKDFDNINIQTSLKTLLFSNNQFRYGMASNNALISAYLKQYQKNKTFEKK